MLIPRHIVQQESIKTVLQGIPCRQGVVHYIKYLCCSLKVCIFPWMLWSNHICIHQFKAVSPCHASLVILEEMSLVIKKNLPNCPLSSCCSFSAVIPNNVHCTLFRPQRAPQLQSQADSSDNEDKIHEP